MRRISFFILILCAVAFSGMWEIKYLTESSRYFISDISDVCQTALREDYKSAVDSSNALKDTWREIKSSWALFINDGEIDSIDEYLTNFTSYIFLNNNEEVVKEYNNLVSKINHVVDFQKIKIENIF